MAGGKETPRQKMIGMMYLVLTALLALNVSKDILDAFIQIDDGLNVTNNVLNDKAASTLRSLQEPKPEDAEKAKPFAAKALEVEQWSKDMISYIEEMKARVMAASHKSNADGAGFEEYMKDGKAIPPGTLDEDGKPVITKKDENQNNTTLLVGANPESPRTDPFSANELKAKLTDFKNKLVAIKIAKADSSGKSFELPEDVKSSLENTFALPAGKDHDGKDAPWETHNFYHMPLVAVIASLSKIETDVMNSKNNVITSLAQGINATDLKFTDVTVAVVPQQSYVIKGDEYSVEVFLAAFNKTSQTKVYMGGQYNGDTKPTTPSNFTPSGEGISSNSEGKCVFKTSTGGMSLGPHGYTGMIAYMKDGKEEYIPFATPPFFVGEAALVVSPTNMNVFYRGLDNPVEVSVPGVDKSALRVSMDGGSISGPGSDGTYNVKPGDGKEATIRVSAKINGKDTQMPAKKFRIKTIPDPVPSFGGKRPSDNTISSGELTVASGIKAAMENFDFPVTATVTSFNVSIYVSGSWKDFPSNGRELSTEGKAALSRLKRGEKFYLERIMCKMPDGTERKLSGIGLRVS